MYYAKHRILSQDFVFRSEDILHFNSLLNIFLKGGLLCVRN
jgi:hypothetical protein